MAVLAMVVLVDVVVVVRLMVVLAMVRLVGVAVVHPGRDRVLAVRRHQPPPCRAGSGPA